MLVGLVYKEQTETQVQEYLDELAFLAETAGAVAVKKFERAFGISVSCYIVSEKHAAVKESIIAIDRR